MKKLLVLLVAAVMLAIGANAGFEKVNTYSDNFTDVKDSSWYAENVKTAYELGFMNGKSEGKFDPNGNVTVVEGITMAARLHAIYNGNEIKKEEKKEIEEYRIEFDDPEILVDLSQRNSRNTHGVNFNRAFGRIEDSMLICQPDAPNAAGNYDPQIKFEGLELPAKDYNKVIFRMKRDVLPDIDDRKRNEVLEFYFQTSVSPNIDAPKCVYIKLPKDQDLSDWFVVEADLGNHEKWTDMITGFRFDPTNITVSTISTTSVSVRAKTSRAISGMICISTMLLKTALSVRQNTQLMNITTISKEAKSVICSQQLSLKNTLLPSMM